jgi:hypothetical protein
MVAKIARIVTTTISSTNVNQVTLFLLKGRAGDGLAIVYFLCFMFSIYIDIIFQYKDLRKKSSPSLEN